MLIGLYVFFYIYFFRIDVGFERNYFYVMRKFYLIVGVFMVKFYKVFRIEIVKMYVVDIRV